MALENGGHGLEAISFVGRYAYLASGEGAKGFLDDFKTRVEGAGIRVNILSELDSPQATQYLHDTAGLVFIPSLLDNFPYAVLECIHHSFEVFASRCGGIPEILTDGHLFEPSFPVCARRSSGESAGKRRGRDTTGTLPENDGWSFTTAD